MDQEGTGFGAGCSGTVFSKFARVETVSEFLCPPVSSAKAIRQEDVPVIDIGIANLCSRKYNTAKRFRGL